MKELDLYDDKGSCQICSSTYVKTRIHPTEQAAHAKRHIDAGDPVERRYSAGTHRANAVPDLFLIVTG